ncbi:cathepsin Q-like [Peromyscus eremicus]|uniref:cathepsin Q-like n=1 Tax=Peromyscus eremicus TaxID=42410 RepID=UPI0027DDEE0B|nr:cathepsin Q-like [Peromyscus eremicus]
MTSAVFLVILCIRIMSGASAHDPSLDAEWEEWKMDYEKSYSLEEEAMRRRVWEKNLKIIKDHNGENGLGNKGYTMEMNSFGDMTGEEFKDMMVNFPIQPHNKRKSIWKCALGGIGLPRFVDWRKKGYMTPVWNQGKCGLCWAFTVAGAIEGQMYHKTGKVTPLSVQNLVDCSKPHGNNGYALGNTYNASQYVLHNGGVEAEATYPYERKLYHFSDCGNNSPIAGGSGHCIYHEPNCSSSVVNHAVLVVDYGYEGDEMDGNNYWLIKNTYKLPNLHLKFQRIDRLKLGINNSGNIRELTNSWKQNKLLPNEKWIKTEIEKDDKDYLEFNGTKRIHKISNVMEQNKLF